MDIDTFDVNRLDLIHIFDCIFKQFFRYISTPLLFKLSFKQDAFFCSIDSKQRRRRYRPTHRGQLSSTALPWGLCFKFIRKITIFPTGWEDPCHAHAHGSLAFLPGHVPSCMDSRTPSTNAGNHCSRSLRGEYFNYQLTKTKQFLQMGMTHQSVTINAFQQAQAINTTVWIFFWILRFIFPGHHSDQEACLSQGHVVAKWGQTSREAGHHSD